MARKYTQGASTPKGIAITTNEPIDQRSVVALLTDLYSPTLKAYPGMKVIVEEAVVINSISETLREFKFKGGDSTNSSNWTFVSTSGNIDVSTLPLQFKSFVFKRNIGTPTTPTGGTYGTPVPTGWSDGVPSGTNPLWMSSAVLVQGSSATVSWVTPIILEDNNNIDYQYCTLSAATTDNSVVNGIPLPPLESPAQRTYWHTVPALADNFMATGVKIGGAYPISWNIVKITGEDGAAGSVGAEGRKYNTSIVFTRVNDPAMNRAIVKGGGFSTTVPTLTTIDGNTKAITWSDGIPDGTATVWMTKFTFNSIDHAIASSSNTWTTPNSLSDTGSVDFKFSTQVATPDSPTINASIWSDTATSATIWVAQRTVKNGVFGSWMIYKVKGETGQNGQGLQIAGRDTISNILLKTTPATSLLDLWVASNTEAGAAVPGITNDSYLFLGAGNGDNSTAWSNIGNVVGTDGVSYKQSNVFKRSVNQPTAPTGGTFLIPVPTGWSDGIPTATASNEKVWMSSRYFADKASINSGLSNWNSPTLATDTADTDFQYAVLQAGDTTPLAPNLAPNGVWTSTGNSSTVWMAKAKVLNGVTDNSTWQILRIKGEKGANGSDGVPSFLSSAYIKLPTGTDISSTNITGGTYASPIPTTTHSGKSWSSGIPSGTGALWFAQVKFLQTDTANNKVWPAAVIVSDSSIVEYSFSASVPKPLLLPIEASSGTNSWYNTSDEILNTQGVIRWMAIGNKRNGEWPSTWDIISVIGEKGATGSSSRTYIPSSMFVRCDDINIQSYHAVAQYLVDTNGVFTVAGAAPTISVGGTTYTFSDGIPDITNTFPGNAARIWEIHVVFNSVDNLGSSKKATWSFPSLLADNNSVDFKYHPGLGAAHTAPGDPSTAQTGWVDTPSSSTYWIGSKNWSEGVSATWKVYKIRGEDGGVDTWKSFSVYNVSHNTSIEACALADTFGTVLKYHTGAGLTPSVGDKVAINSTGATLYNGSSKFITNGTSSWRVNSVGIVEVVEACAGVTTPSTPSKLTAALHPTLSNTIVLDWFPSDGGAAGIYRYSIKKSTNGGAFATVNIVLSPNVIYNDSIVPGNNYCYKVTAENLYGTFSTDSLPICLAVSSAGTTMGVPTSLISSNLADTSFSLAWTQGAGATPIGYYVYNDGILYSSVHHKAFTNVTGQAAGVSSNWTVKAFDSLGNITAASTPLAVLQTGAPI